MRRFLLLVLLAIICFAAPCHAADGVFNVRDYGAAGDGKTDDTAAIQKALDAAKTINKGAVVVLSAGEYRVTKTLTVEGVLLKGLDAGGWPADKGPLPTLLVDHTDGACILAKDAASIHGINFEYDHKAQQDRGFGPAVLLSGNGISVTNLRIHQPTEGIMSDGITNIGRLNIENVFIIAARRCGVFVTGTWDIPTLRNIEVWNPPTFCLDTCVGFKLGKNDLLRMDNCFAFQCKIGYQFIDDRKIVKGEKGVTWGQMTGCSADACVQGIVIEAAEALQITGGSLWCHGTSVRISGPGRIVITGMEMQANGDSQLIITDCGNVTISACRFGKAGDTWHDVYAARFEGGKNVILNACNFDNNSRGIFIGDKMDRFSITNNIFAESPYVSITDKSVKSAKKIIKDNLTSGEAPKKAK